MAAMIKIEMKKNIPEMDKQLAEAVPSIVDELSSHALLELQTRAPVRSGVLRSSFFRIISGDKLSAEIVSSASYVMMVEKGTRPHAIVAKNVKALRFFVGSQEVFAKRVHHPGTKGRFFIQATVEAIKSIIPAVVQKYLEKVGKKI